MEILQSIFNWISDSLIPLGRFRPEKNERFGARHYRFFGTVMIPSLMFVIALVLLMTAALTVTTSPRLQHTPRAVLWFMGYTIAHLGWVIPAGALVYIVSWAPFVFFWNRRASRLRKGPGVDPLIAEHESWPPPPRRD